MISQLRISEVPWSVLIGDCLRIDFLWLPSVTFRFSCGGSTSVQHYHLCGLKGMTHSLLQGWTLIGYGVELGWTVHVFMTQSGQWDAWRLSLRLMREKLLYFMVPCDPVVVICQHGSSLPKCKSDTFTREEPRKFLTVDAIMLEASPTSRLQFCESVTSFPVFFFFPG